MIRIATMSLRIAWALQQRDANLAISASVFVYAGTIILFIINWFFTQRIVRAQHPQWGWSQTYRILHRTALVCLILCLLLLIIAAVQQFFTLDYETLQIDRYLQLTGQTYMAAFCFAPIPLVLLSLAIPRKATEKFGAGRLRNNIAILLVAATVLSIGAIFRCIIAWVPPTPLRNGRGPPPEPPWYLSKTCFYTFNFTTELFVVITYAVTRVDLRFHIPDGANGPGAYKAGRLDRNPSQPENLEFTRASMTEALDGSYNTMHSRYSRPDYYTSIFDDTHALVDSYRYPPSVLEVDSNTGHWKLRETPRPGSGSTRFSQMSDPSLAGPLGHDIPLPPMPPMPPDWPLPAAQSPPESAVPVLEHRNTHNTHRRKDSAGGESAKTGGSHEFGEHGLNGVDLSSAVEYAVAQMEVSGKIVRKGKSVPDKNSRGKEYVVGHLERRPKSSGASGSTSNLEKRKTRYTGDNAEGSWKRYRGRKGGGGRHGSADVGAAEPVIRRRGERSETLPRYTLVDRTEETRRQSPDVEDAFRTFSFVADPREGEDGYEELMREKGRDGGTEESGNDKRRTF